RGARFLGLGLLGGERAAVLGVGDRLLLHELAVREREGALVFGLELGARLRVGGVGGIALGAGGRDGLVGGAPGGERAGLRFGDLAAGGLLELRQLVGMARLGLAERGAVRFGGALRGIRERIAIGVQLREHLLVALGLFVEGGAVLLAELALRQLGGAGDAVALGDQR